MPQKISPNRRRSIAVLSRGPASRQAQNRRRAYSIVPGEKLSPAAKARRSLAPRKSILKGSINIPAQDAAESSVSASIVDDTRTMDFTEVQPANPRKSLGRRVSFASHAHVRLFEIQEQNTNGSNDPPSSPAQDPSSQANDENIHPDAAPSRRRSSVRRRSSTAFSEFGERSMDMDLDDTAPFPQDFLNQGGEYDPDGSALQDEEFTDQDDDEEDMEITEAVRLNIERKRSLSLGGRRRSSIAPVTSSQNQSENQRPPNGHGRPPALPEENEDAMHEQSQDLSMSSTQSQSFASEGSGGDDTAPMEFTVPISRSLRPPEPPNELWQQLRAMTHAGAEPEEPPPPDSDDEDGLFVQGSHASPADPSGMELTDAMTRLQKARSSFGFAPPTQPDFNADEGGGEMEMQEDTFTSTEDSFGDDALSGDRTVNVTSLIRSSLGTDSSMDVTSVYHAQTEEDALSPPSRRSPSIPSSVSPEPPATSQPTPAPSAPLPSPSGQLPVSEPGPVPRPFVFSLPRANLPPKTPAALPKSPVKPATVPKPFSFSLPRAASPTKAPLASSIESPTPSRIPQPSQRGSAAFAPPASRKSPLKRGAPPEDEADHRPSPAKRAAVGKLEPAKKAMFEQRSAPTPVQLPANRRTSMARRPSGYFAQRKSLGAGVLPPAQTAVGPASADPQKGPAPSAGSVRARASMGGVPSGAGLSAPPKSAITAQAGHSLYPDVAQIEREDPPTPTRAASPAPRGASCERETIRQAIAAPSPSRGSPVPSPRPRSPAIAPVSAQPPAAARKSISPANAPPSTASPAIAPTAPVPLHTNITPQLAPTVPARDEEMADAERPANAAALTATQQWREGVQDEHAMDDNEEPPITIEQFFAMTGIKFMDELVMPKTRQSVGPPIKLRNRGGPRSSTGSNAEAEEDPVALAEFSVAMAVEVPALELYSSATNELSAWIEESKKICLQTNHETEEMTPGLFREFASADESEKGMLLHQLKLIKANNYATAKSQWYDWRLHWVQQLYTRADQEFSNLESDAQFLATVIKQSQELLPELREDYSRVMAELAQEEADIAEIENSDQDYLNELKTTIAEQTVELETFRTDVSEATAKLDRLQEKLSEIDSEKREISSAISHAQHIIHIQKESTSAEVFRLKDELEALQDLHLWRATKITADLIEFVYASRYHVSIPCVKYKPTPARVDIARAPHSRTKERDGFPRFTDAILQTAKQLVAAMPADTDVRMIIERLGDLWSSCAQLRSQLTFLAIKYPLAVDAVQSLENTAADLRARATVLFPSAKGKAYISFILDSQTYANWPISIGSLRWDVEVVYGQLERERISKAILGRLSQASAADSHGCLLDACIEATEQYE